MRSTSPPLLALSHLRLFPPEALDLIERTALQTVREVAPREDIILEGNRPGTVKLILEGWVARYKQLPDGRRQILGIMLPGDICDANAFVVERMDHSLGALTRVRIACISRSAFEELLTSHPAMTRVFWASELVTASIQCEWTVNIGQRPARERIAHLFCELHARLRTVGLAGDDMFEFPLTQSDLAEATGLTSVHVNRTLQVMRGDGLIELHDKRLRLIDTGRLKKIAMFDPAYLYIDRSVEAD